MLFAISEPLFVIAGYLLVIPTDRDSVFDIIHAMVTHLSVANYLCVTCVDMFDTIPFLCMVYVCMVCLCCIW
jgi:hypothetical protein